METLQHDYGLKLTRVPDELVIGLHSAVSEALQNPSLSLRSLAHHNAHLYGEIANDFTHICEQLDGGGANELRAFLTAIEPRYRKLVGLKL